VRNWDVEERYKSDNLVEREKIKNAINNLEDFLKWIEKN